MLILKSFEIKAMPPLAQDDALAIINKLAIEPVQPDSVYVGRMRLANDRVDRSGERFPVPFLERFAETLPGKPLLEGHDKSKSPSGRFFAASLARDDMGVTHLIADYYLPAQSDLTQKVKLGIASSASIGFTAAQRTCDICDEKYDGPGQHRHEPLREYDGQRCTLTYSGDPRRVEAMEGSLVWVGCQYGAQTIEMKAWQSGAGVAEIDPDELEADVEKAELEALVTKLQSEKAELEKTAGLAAEGKQYRLDLKTEIARKLGVLERAEELPLSLLDAADLETLKAYDTKLGEEINKKLPAGVQSKMLNAPDGKGAALVPQFQQTDQPPERLRTSPFRDWNKE